ncbi:hypothetical protein Btru_075428 [Bulinus truncatus]|nr:hypothetical protein Btru_075428 [Bulinus truncatus]
MRPIKPLAKNTLNLLDWQNEPEKKHRLQSLKQPNKQEIILSETLSQNSLKKCSGKSILLNDEQIALFRLGSHVYATQALCPHAGGPLHLADIEDIGSSEVCIKCPWHKWKFRLKDGVTVHPKGHQTVAKIYPVKVDIDGQLFVGFDSFGQSAFNLE